MPSRPRPAPISSSVLDQAAVNDIISAVVKAVSAAIPEVPAAVANQIHEESVRACRDISVATSSARRSIQEAVRTGLACFDVKIAEVKAQTKKMVDNKKLAADRDWLALLGSGYYFCAVCTKHSNLFTNIKQQKSIWIAGNGGVDPANYRLGKPFTHQVCIHEGSEMHLLAVGFQKDRAAMSLATTFGRYKSHAEAVTETLMRTAIDGVVNYRAFNDFENLVYLQHLNGVDVGDWQHGRQAAAAMLGIAAEEWQEQMQSFLSTPLTSTGHLPYMHRYCS